MNSMHAIEKLKDWDVFIQVFELEKKRLGLKFASKVAELMGRDKTLLYKILNRKVPVSDDMAEASLAAAG